MACSFLFDYQLGVRARAPSTAPICFERLAGPDARPARYWLSFPRSSSRIWPVYLWQFPRRAVRPWLAVARRSCHRNIRPISVWPCLVSEKLNGRPFGPPFAWLHPVDGVGRETLPELEICFAAPVTEQVDPSTGGGRTHGSREMTLPKRPPIPVELDLLVLSFMGHFTWELLQAPLFSSLADKGHIPGILICLQATLGDLGIALAAFWVASIAGRGRDWAAYSRAIPVAVYLSTGLALTIGFEFLSTEILDRWTYAPEMPRLPLLGTGISPFLQWLIIPSLVLWYLKRLSLRNVSS